MVEDLRVKVATAIRLLEFAGLVDHSGHISARVPGTDRFLINARATSRTSVTPEDVVMVDLSGRQVEGEVEAPGETPIHTCIYRARGDVASVAHIHPPISTLFTIAGRPILPVFVLGAPVGPVPVYGDPDLIYTERQAEAMVEVLGSRRAVMIRGHGGVTVGANLEEAFVLAVYLEENCKKQLYASLLGTPIPLSEDEVRRITNNVWKPRTVRKVWNYFEEKARAAGVL